MFHATTVLAIRHNGQAVMASDGQVTLGDTVVKQRARKIRRLYNERILAGFAGSAADSFALFSRFEGKLEQYRGNLERSAVELAKEWRTDRVLRRLEAMLVVMDAQATYLISGNGDLIEPEKEMLLLFLEGWSVPQISQRVGRVERTVRRFREKVWRKLHDLGIGAGIERRHGHRGRRHLRILSDRQRPHRHEARKRDDHGDDRREDRPIDEEA